MSCLKINATEVGGCHKLDLVRSLRVSIDPKRHYQRDTTIQQ
jgi:hypothetical protein